MKNDGKIVCGLDICERSGKFLKEQTQKGVQAMIDGDYGFEWKNSTQKLLSHMKDEQVIYWKTFKGSM